MRRVLPLLVLLVLSLIPACKPGSEEKICTTIGCVSAITLKLTGPDGKPVTEAAGKATSGGKTWTFQCSAPKASDDYSFDCTPEGLMLHQPAEASALTLDVTAKAEGGGAVAFKGEQALTLTKSQPNGPECDPTCYAGEVSVQLAAP